MKYHKGESLLTLLPLCLNFSDDLQYRDFVEQLEQTGRPNFTPELKADLSFFLVLQLFRTLEHRGYIEEMLNKGGTALARMSLRVAKAHNAPNVPDIEDNMIDQISMKYDARAISLHHTMLLLDFEQMMRFAEILRQHIWYIGVNNTPYPFWTSDNPVVRHAHKKEPFRSNWGLASPGIEIAFPLTPKYVLTMAERSYFSQYAWLEGTTYPLNKDNVTFYNSMQVNDSFQQIYSFKSEFSLAQKMCRKNPELTNPNRPRVLVNGG